MKTFAGELMSKDGLPLFLAPENSFLGKIELYSGEKAKAEKPFVIVESDGSKHVWNGSGGMPESEITMPAAAPDGVKLATAPRS